MISIAEYYQRHTQCRNEPPTYYSAFIEQVCGRHGNVTTTTMKLTIRAWSIFNFDRKVCRLISRKFEGAKWRILAMHNRDARRRISSDIHRVITNTTSARCRNWWRRHCSLRHSVKYTGYFGRIGHLSSESSSNNLRSKSGDQWRISKN